MAPSQRNCPNPPLQTICPEVLVIGSDLSDDHSVSGTTGPIPASASMPLDLQEDVTCTELEGDTIRSFPEIPQQVAGSQGPTNARDDPNLDLLLTNTSDLPHSRFHRRRTTPRVS
jgi:hypothetical protein